MAKRFQSAVWEFFELVVEESVKCKLCNPPVTVRVNVACVLVLL